MEDYRINLLSCKNLTCVALSELIFLKITSLLVLAFQGANNVIKLNDDFDRLIFNNSLFGREIKQWI